MKVQSLGLSLDHEAQFLCLALVMKAFKAKSLALESETCP